MTILNDEYQSMAANAICHAANMTQAAMESAIGHYTVPSVIWKPRLFIDGSSWCALYGDNLQSGVAGFGDSPQEAMWDFDLAWGRKLAAPKPGDRPDA
jgi:hypothetical protein